MSTVADEVRSYVVAEFLDGEDTTDLTSEFDLVDSGIVDSLALVRIISHLSNTYSIPVDDIPLKADNFRSIGAIVDFVENQVQAVN